MKIHDAFLVAVLGTMSQPCWDHKPISKIKKKHKQQNKMIEHGT